MAELERTINEMQERSRVEMERTLRNPMVQVNAQRDFARGGMNLHVRAFDSNSIYGGMAVIEHITWRALRPDEEAPASQSFFMDERAARHLAEQLADFNPRTRRLESIEQQQNETRAELRNVANQLTEVREHNETLVNTNHELARQVRWLERELRDANRERRDGGRITTPHP